MSENNGAETLAEGEDHLLQLPSKRKPSLEPPVSDPKKPKPDGETRVGEEEEAETKAPNGNAAVDKGKGILKEDYKGKGKSKIVEPDSSSSSDDDGGGRDPDGEDDSDFSDDPLAEVDLSNIVSSRTRRRAAHPGAYLDVEDGGDDDDDDVADLVDVEDDSDDEEEDTDGDSE